MAFPLPAQFGANTTSTTTLFVPQPNGQEMIRAERIETTGGSSVKNGLDGVVLRWARLTQDQFKVLVAHYRSALSNGTYYYVKFWDDEASDGGGGYGAYAASTCVIRTPPDYDTIEGEHYVNVTMTFHGLGVAIP